VITLLVVVLLLKVPFILSKPLVLSMMAKTLNDVEVKVLSPVLEMVFSMDLLYCFLVNNKEKSQSFSSQ